MNESETPTQTETVDTSVSDGSDGTQESDLTEAFEITTQSSTDVTEKESKDDDDYEIVPDTNCDDGEWVVEKHQKVQ